MFADPDGDASDMLRRAIDQLRQEQCALEREMQHVSHPSAPTAVAGGPVMDERYWPLVTNPAPPRPPHHRNRYPVPRTSDRSNSNSSIHCIAKRQTPRAPLRRQQPTSRHRCARYSRNCRRFSSFDASMKSVPGLRCSATCSPCRTTPHTKSNANSDSHTLGPSPSPHAS